MMIIYLRGQPEHAAPLISYALARRGRRKTFRSATAPTVTPPPLGGGTPQPHCICIDMDLQCVELFFLGLRPVIFYCWVACGGYKVLE